MEKEVELIIKQIILDYTNYDEDIEDLVQICRVDREKAIKIVSKRYPQFMTN